MQFADDETIAAYRAAWEDWQKQLNHLHRVFFEGEAIRPDQMKGLLNREARKKEVYDSARARLLGLDEVGESGSAEPLADPGANPFKRD